MKNVSKGFQEGIGKALAILTAGYVVPKLPHFVALAKSTTPDLRMRASASLAGILFLLLLAKIGYRKRRERQRSEGCVSVSVDLMPSFQTQYPQFREDTIGKVIPPKPKRKP